MSNLAFTQTDSTRPRSSPPKSGFPSSGGVGGGGGGASRRPNYLVASHSIRITKHGYAIEPIELRFAEVSNKLTAAQRRQSDQALDSNQLGHKVLTLIRGFWSQPAWPRGRQMNSKQQQQQEQTLQQMFRLTPGESPIDSLITCFRSTSFYPHKSTLGHMSVAPVSPPPPPPQVTTFKQLKQQQQQQLRRPAAKDSKRGNKKSSGSSASSSNSSSGGSSSVSQSRSQRPTLDPKQFYMSWIPKNKDLIAELISELCQKVEQVFIGEPRVLNIKSPCLVLGDIHGNLMDLRTYERSLWPKAPSCLTNNYLFLGDYVDRGEYSVECVVYLFAMKLIAPDRFYMLRGNHEIASIQRQYTFNTECEAKFGVAGRQLWRSFNRVFNVMPIAAIIDEQIFCAHGGIPRSASDIGQLAREIPSPLDNPEIQSPAAWEILWNDPITDSELLAMLEMDSIPAQTFTPSLSLQDSSRPAGGPSTTQGLAQGQPQPQPQQQQQQQQQQQLATSVPPATPAPQPPENGPQKDATTSITTIKSVASGAPPVQPKTQFDSALSFYIKPEPQAEKQASKKEQNATESPDSRAQQAQRQAPSPSGGGSSSSDGLRSVPSDTSSIASNSPAQMLNDGFVANIKRGTAFLFSDRAIESFLEANRFSHIIRAHEVIPTGFAFHGDGRVLTIFSSSQYCGLNNQAACALVEGERIRILRLDTGQAGE